MTRATTAALTLPILLTTVLLAGCAEEEPAATAPSTTATTPAPATATPTPSESSFAGTEIEVAVRDGEVTPPLQRVELTQGTQVRLLVTSDTADELHIHGFDITQELPAGQQATVDFTADQTGIFEIETHDSGLQLVQLEVR